MLKLVVATWLQKGLISWGQFHQPLCAKRKVAGAQRLAKKVAIQFHQHSALMKMPNLNCEIHQINSLFTKHHSPKKVSHLVLSKKPREYVGEIDPWCSRTMLLPFITKRI